MEVGQYPIFMNKALDNGVVTQPAQGLWLPAWQRGQRTVAQHPRLAGQFVVLTENQRRHRAAPQVAGAYAFAAIATGECDFLPAVGQHVRVKMPGDTQVAAPGVSQANIAQNRE
ncbi:hypothetical protein D3C80_1652340 [compost metagenome]